MAGFVAALPRHQLDGTWEPSLAGRTTEFVIAVMAGTFEVTDTRYLGDQASFQTYVNPWHSCEMLNYHKLDTDRL
jgi:hypothetical protein